MSWQVCEHESILESVRRSNLAKSHNYKASERAKNIHYLLRTNQRHCNFFRPIYGTDLHEIVDKMNLPSSYTNFVSNSYSNCHVTKNYQLTSHKPDIYWSQTKGLSSLLNIVEDQLFDERKNHELSDILSRFVVYVPSVVYPSRNFSLDPFSSPNGIRLHIPHPKSSTCQRQKILIEDITNKIISRKMSDKSRAAEGLLSRVASAMSTQFPEKRLIQYDCGKLQTMSTLLRSLFAESHRVLVFTQMTKMLDVLENFLNYHGYKYLRLDGSTSIERRQTLMESFNNDKRIFCFILSTRSGGIGINLTGADTVIFYDSDWNPTMDAQAQDRCHRIGQTRDVHIYRLISEKTVEENILKKASQKRLLSEMTIEGGCFTTALLRKHHITELFDNETSNHDSSSNEETPSVLVTDKLAQSMPSPPPKQTAQVAQFEEVSIYFIEFFSF